MPVFDESLKEHKKILKNHALIIANHAKKIKHYTEVAGHVAIEIALGYIVFLVGGNLHTGVVHESNSKAVWSDPSSWVNASISDGFTILITGFFTHQLILETSKLFKRERWKTLDLGSLYMLLGAITTISFIFGDHFDANLVPQWILNWDYDITIFTGGIIVILVRKVIKILKEDVKLLTEDNDILREDNEILRSHIVTSLSAHHILHVNGYQKNTVNHTETQG
ncbi:MAG: hypothetical protein Ctma_0557 [Catillopecten margaritatus gill symbiont]|uniref:Cation-transporting P-type ATPase C-terminal domain-containing protein n=1 Tax=Catillopecten margaritatus gill symbiont TaxID=3083288 RepID=A0AAU6PFR9_9GAMM